MGYREYLIKFKNDSSFNSAAAYLREHEEEFNIYFSPCTVVTFKEKLDVGYTIKFDQGEKSICLQGDSLAGIKEFIFRYDTSLINKCELVSIDLINENTLNKLFKTHELADEQDFDNYVLKLQGNNHKYSRKEFLKDYLRTSLNFKKNAAKCHTKEERKNTALEFLSNVFSLNDKYHSHIKELNDICGAVASELKKDFGITKNEINFVIEKHSEKSVTDIKSKDTGSQQELSK